MRVIYMKKIESGSKGGYLIPHPITLVSAYDKEGKPNAYTQCWMMNIGHKPPKIAFITREHRYTYTLFKENGYFGVNIPSPEIIKEVDFFGRNSGKDIDKFAATNFNVFKGTKADVPLIKECHINFECKVIDTQTIEDTMIIIFAEVLNSHYNEDLFNEEGKLDESKIPMMVYGYSYYWGVNKKVGSVGMSKEDKN
ncbi:MAG: flavin reductase family protein [Asgard group archaeon]|nr:flavin reductase family protein [Asgard group archaeon]